MPITRQTAAKKRCVRMSKSAAAKLRIIVLETLAQKPHSLADMMIATDATRGAIAHQLYWLGDLGLVACTGSGPKAVWSVTEHYLQNLKAEAAPKLPQPASPCVPEAQDTIPIVRVYADPAWTLPAAEVTHANGVRITRQAAPAPRFAVRLQPGTGVISLDNPRLASLASRRTSNTGTTSAKVAA
jgi:hypothetical protein